MAKSDRERELIRYSVMKSSGLTPTGVRQHFGFEHMKERIASVEECIDEARRIQEDIDLLSQVADQSLLISEMPSDSDTEVNSDNDVVDLEPTLSPSSNMPDFHTLTKALEDSQFNLFCLEELLQDMGYDEKEIEHYLKSFYTHAMQITLLPEHKSLLTASHSTYIASSPDPTEQRVARVLNGDVVTDDPEHYINIDSLASDRAKSLITRKESHLLEECRG